MVFALNEISQTQKFTPGGIFQIFLCVHSDFQKKKFTHMAIKLIMIFSAFLNHHLFVTCTKHPRQKDTF
jgi:hypothetical protein